jgi:hypothetical protein
MGKLLSKVVLQAEGSGVLLLDNRLQYQYILPYYIYTSPTLRELSDTFRYTCMSP